MRKATAGRLAHSITLLHRGQFHNNRLKPEMQERRREKSNFAERTKIDMPTLYKTDKKYLDYLTVTRASGMLKTALVQ